MGDPKYKRTSGYRNFVNQMKAYPTIFNNIVTLGEREYIVRGGGWRRIKPQGADSLREK